MVVHSWEVMQGDCCEFEARLGDIASSQISQNNKTKPRKKQTVASVGKFMEKPKPQIPWEGFQLVPGKSQCLSEPRASPYATTVPCGTRIPEKSVDPHGASSGIQHGCGPAAGKPPRILEE